MRSVNGRAACSIARFCAPLKPAVITTAARQPRAPSSPINPGTLAGGVQITARSGAAGRSATLATTGAPRSGRRGLNAIRSP